MRSLSFPFLLLAAAAALPALPAAAQRPPLADIEEVIKEAELPPSRATGEVEAGEGETEAPAKPSGEDAPAASGDVLEATAILSAEAEAQAEADAAWEARQEARRAAINAEEGPIVDRLNRRIAAAHAATERRNAEAQAAYERELAELEAEARAAERAHQAALEAHARAVEAQRRDYERRVALCLAGEHQYCAAEPRRR